MYNERHRKRRNSTWVLKVSLLTSASAANGDWPLFMHSAARATPHDHESQLYRPGKLPFSNAPPKVSGGLNAHDSLPN